MKRRTIVSLILAAIWALFTWIGHESHVKFSERIAASYFADGEKVFFYIVLPAVGCVFSLVGAMIGQKDKAGMSLFLPLASFLALSAYLMLYGGGV